MTSDDHNLILSERAELARGGDETHPILSKLASDLLARADERVELFTSKSRDELEEPDIESLIKVKPGAWQAACEIVFLIVDRVARDQGLSSTEALIVGQKVLTGLVKPELLEKYETFADLKHLIRAMAKQRVIDWLRKKSAEKRGPT